KPTIEGAAAAYAYIRAAAAMAVAGEAAALVTAPISKEWLNRAGYHFPGHTELLAEIAGVRRFRMMFTSGHLCLALATVHIGLAEVPARLNPELVFDTIDLLAEHLRTHYGMSCPKVAVLGLNPHAGEGGLFGREEIDAIQPAIARARALGIDALGPLPPDTAFVRQAGRFRFDGAVAMYHDQGLIPIKMLDFDHAVNVTLGLPWVRTSPDHGTGYDIAGQGRARADSMLAAIRFAAQAAARRERAVA
ncbi:MAG TPA: 4-hydroxythreonine-4-phosphate dehydrogenase PdxA, partial [Candidatus Binataceae bacterium]|nr:4-hydroxythreonine-4-phosphate dehydrogenase PdxA [Candidatus Binataceae bacterium]